MRSFLDEQYSNTVHFRLLALERAIDFSKSSPDYFEDQDILNLARRFETYILSGVITDNFSE